jgi:hypothetical protein
MNKLSEEDLKKRKDSAHNLTLGDIRKFLEKYPDLPDDCLVFSERIEDVYFDKHGWKVLPVKGYWYYSHKDFNEKMQEEIERRKRGEEPEYSMEDPSKHIVDLEDDNLLEQFVLGNCITKDKNDNILIYIHY